MDQSLLQIEEPEDYFSGRGARSLPVPKNILLFIRHTRRMLQQEALQNRSHHRFVLAFNLKTEGHIHVDHLTFPFRPGQALLILPYQFHHFSMLSSNALQWLFCTFELEPPGFLEPLRNRPVDVSAETRSAFSEVVKAWHGSGGELETELLQTDLLKLLLQLKKDRLRSSADLPPEPEESLLRRLNRFLAEQHGRTITVADVAMAFDCSESRLRELFREAAGIPLGSYLRNYRINRAMALLRNSERSIADVAEEAGFGSPQAFSRIFKKATGLTPRAYRTAR